MKIEQIMKLIDAGYTKEEIQAMQTGESEATPEAQPESQAEGAGEPEATSESQPEENGIDYSKMFESLNKSILEFDKKIKSLNSSFAEIKNSDNMKLSDSDIIAKIIQPSYKEEK